MKQLVILHGMGADNTAHWAPYLVNQFEGSEYEIIAPNLPNTDAPTYDSWVGYFEENVNLTPETTIVAHSASCPLVLSVLERSEVGVYKVILVSGLVDILADEIRPLMQEQYDWEKIKRNANEFIFINTTRDPYGCNDVQGRKMLDVLGGTQIIIDSDTHFGTSEFNDVCEEFPLLVKLIND